MTRPVNPQAFVALWQSELPVARICDETGLARATVYRRAEELSLPPRDPVRRALQDGAVPGGITLPKLRCLSDQ